MGIIIYISYECWIWRCSWANVCGYKHGILSFITWDMTLVK